MEQSELVADYCYHVIVDSVAQYLDDNDDNTLVQVSDEYQQLLDMFNELPRSEWRCLYGKQS